MFNYKNKILSSFSVAGFVILLSCQHTQSPIPTPSAKTDPTVLVIPTIEIASPKLPPHCPDDMVYIDKTNSCIDQYEAPNQKGVKPFAAQTAYQGVTYCKAHGKDLCSEEQWHTACIGPQNKLYSYSDVYKLHACNDDQTGWKPVPWLEMGSPAWTQWCKVNYKAEPSGNRPSCVSDYGVYDMVGNVEEWVKSPTGNGGYAFVGGYWYNYMGRLDSCDFAVKAHSPAFNSYEIGFRCCSDAK
jgi:formylglycine-generating enzyme required for sulfatase activity